MTTRLHGLILLAAAAATTACGGMTLDDAPGTEVAPQAPQNGRVTIEDVTRLPSDENGFSSCTRPRPSAGFRMRVANGTSAPVYVYTEALGGSLDAASRRLRVVMHEVPHPPTGSSADCHVHVPAIRELAAGAVVDIDVRVGRSWEGASHVDVELGFGDHPMAIGPHDPLELCTFDAETLMKSRERGIALGGFDL